MTGGATACHHALVPPAPKDRRVAMQVRLPADLKDRLGQHAAARLVSANLLVSRAVTDLCDRLDAERAREAERG